MANCTSLSVQAEVVLDKALSRSFSRKDTAKDLIVFLYAKRDNAQENVLRFVEESSSLVTSDFSEILSVEEVNTLLNEYPAVVSYCYSLLSDDFEFGMAMSIEQDAPIHLLPDSLVKLCSGLVDLQDGASVYLPYSGDMQFAHLNPTCSYEGCEPNEKVWAFSKILTDAFGIQSCVSCNTNCCELVHDAKYDCIFTVPPFVGGAELRTIVEQLKAMVVNNLTDRGVFAGVFPLSFAYSKDWQEFRNIVRDKLPLYSIALIALPPMLNTMSSAQLCVCVLSKNNMAVAALLDARAKEFFAKIDAYDGYEYTLKVDNILETLSKKDESHLWLDLVHHLTDDVDLMPGHYMAERYVPEAEDGEQILALSDLIAPLHCEVAKRGVGELPSINAKDLTTDYLNCKISYSKLSTKRVKGGKIVPTDCLLAFFVGGLFKVAKLVDVPADGKVLIPATIVPFTLKSDIISEDYLLRSFSLESTEKQANALAYGVVLQTLKTSDLFKIRIAVPSAEKQSVVCKQETEAKFQLSDAIYQKLFEEFRQDLHMKKHAIGQNIFNLKNWWETLLWAREEGNGILDDKAIVGLVEQVSVAEIYDNLGKAIAELSERIGKLDRGNGLVAKEFALTTFLEDFRANNKSPLFTFEYKEWLHHAANSVPGVIEKGDPIEWITFPKEALTMILKNIVHNACSHGFSKDNPNNVIRIEVAGVGDTYVLTVANNGKPLAESVTPDDVFTYGRSSQSGKDHFGIGAYEVKRLMEEFGGKAEFISEPTSEFPVAYKLTFTHTNLLGTL